MTIRVLLKSVPLKCNHGGKVAIETDESRNVHDEQSRMVTDHDLIDRSKVTGCPNSPPCVRIVSISVGYAKQLFTKGGEIPLLRNLKAPTDAGGIVTIDEAALMEQARKDFGKFLRKVEGGYHGNVYYNGKLTDPETNKGLTINAWNQYSPDTSHAAFMNMSDANWDAVYQNGYWNPVLTQGGSSIQDPDVAAAMADWNFNGGLMTKSTMTGLQSDVGATADGQYGAGTIDAINQQDPGQMLNTVLDARTAYLTRLGQKPAYAKNLKGWLNRVKALRKFLLTNVRGVPR